MMTQQSQRKLIQIQDAYQMMAAATPDDHALEALLGKLMSMTDFSELSPVHREHFRQAAAAAAALIAMQQSGSTPGFDPIELVCGIPPKAFRLVFARRIAQLHGINIGIEDIEESN